MLQAFHPCSSHFWWACTTTPSWPGSCGISSIPSKTLYLGASVPSIRTGQVPPVALYQRDDSDSVLLVAFSYRVVLVILRRPSGRMCSEHHCRLLLVQRDPQHVHCHWWVGGSTVVDRAGARGCMDSALCVLHSRDRDIWKGVNIALHSTCVCVLYTQGSCCLSHSGCVYHLHPALPGPHHFPCQRTDSERINWRP